LSFIQSFALLILIKKGLRKCNLFSFHAYTQYINQYSKAMETILENGEELRVTNCGINKLLKLGMIYFCTECNFYHCALGYSLDEVEKMIK